MDIHSKDTMNCDLTLHGVMQSDDRNQSDLMVENDNTLSDDRAYVPIRLTKGQRKAILTAVLVSLAVVFIVLICIAVSPKQKEIRSRNSNKTNECDSQPCMHGTCLNSFDRYTCKCFPGFHGTQCEQEIDECNSNPCHRGKCLEGSNKYTCFCDDGFNGTNCENNIDECVSSSCIHGVCLDGIDGFNCSCFNGYTGTRCQVDIDECSQQPCEHGICIHGLETYECECFAGFNGSNCEQEQPLNDNFWIGPVMFESTTRFVNYTLVSGLYTYSDLRACAEASTDNQFLAARVNEATGVCDALTWDWGSDPKYVTGYTYLRKTITVESYHPPHNGNFVWLLPGKFGVGGSMDLYITVPLGTRWSGFEILMLDTTANSFSVYDTDPEVIMVYVQMMNNVGIATVTFKAWYNGWVNVKDLHRTSLADGNAHRLTFVPKATVLQVFLDDILTAEYTHVTDPATAKQIRLDIYKAMDIELHNITFVGV